MVFLSKFLKTKGFKILEYFFLILPLVVLFTTYRDYDVIEEVTKKHSSVPFWFYIIAIIVLWRVAKKIYIDIGDDKQLKSVFSLAVGSIVMFIVYLLFNTSYNIVSDVINDAEVWAERILGSIEQLKKLSLFTTSMWACSALIGYLGYKANAK